MKITLTGVGKTAAGIGGAAALGFLIVLSGPAKPVLPTAVTVITAASCGASDVQAAIDLAVDTNIVDVPSGSCTWPAVAPNIVSIVNKNIWVRGAGVGSTIITADTGGTRFFHYTITNAAKGASQISGITFRGTLGSGSAGIRIDSSGLNAIPTGRWRMHHLAFDLTTLPSNGIGIWGVNYGVIDHVDWGGWQGTNNVVRQEAFLTSESSGISGDLMWSQPLNLGTNNFVFIEDNTYAAAPTSAVGVIVWDSGLGGGRLVYRHNTVVAGLIFAHWNRVNQYEGTLGEIYNNSLTGGTGGAWNAYPARFEAGTVLWHDNTVTGYASSSLVVDERRAGSSGGQTGGLLMACNGASTYDGNFGDPAAAGWPCLAQIGRCPGKTIAAILSGDKQTSCPTYLNNNGPEATCATGGACTDTLIVGPDPAAYIKATAHPNGDVDYVLGGSTPKPGYTPYTYPHPCTTATWPSSC